MKADAVFFSGERQLREREMPKCQSSGMQNIHERSGKTESARTGPREWGGRMQKMMELSHVRRSDHLNGTGSECAVAGAGASVRRASAIASSPVHEIPSTVRKDGDEAVSGQSCRTRLWERRRPNSGFAPVASRSVRDILRKRLPRAASETSPAGPMKPSTVPSDFLYCRGRADSVRRLAAENLNIHLTFIFAQRFPNDISAGPPPTPKYPGRFSRFVRRS